MSTATCFTSNILCQKYHEINKILSITELRKETEDHRNDRDGAMNAIELAKRKSKESQITEKQTHIKI